MKLPKGTDYYSLVIDSGNTLLKVALYFGEKLQWITSFTTLDKASVANLELPEENINGIISSVSASPEEILNCFDLPHLKGRIQWLIFNHETALPVVNKYHTPETLGKDRIAGVVAANAQFPEKDVLVIDAGTAITYDLITKDNEYYGGSISPGLSIRFKALHTFTGRLPLIDKPVTPGESIEGNHSVPLNTEKETLIGHNTEESIITGVMNGALFEIDGFIGAYAKKYPSLISILTGGDAIYFDKKLKSHIFAIPNLVLNGLNLILRYNLEK